MSEAHPEVVSAALAGQPGPAVVVAATALLKACADPTRFRILSALRTGEVCVCDIAAVVGVSESAVSHHLRLLRELDLVRFERRRRMAYYRLADGHVREILEAAVEHAAETAAG